MSPELAAVATTFDLVAPRGDELMDEFYARLFELAPSARPLVPDDLQGQKAKLLATLVLVRRSLDALDSLAARLRLLGARHVAYGAMPEHYAVVGDALVDALAAIVGEEWTAEHERAWRAAVGVIAGFMLEGAAEAGGRRR